MIFSSCTWLFLMKNRSELFSIFKNFYQEIGTQFGVSIRTLHSDNAQDYLSHQFQTYMASHGILHQTSCAHTPQQNEVTERKNCHLIETTRTLLLHGHVPFRFWGDAILDACYLINRMPSSVLGNQFPHSVLFPHTPLHSLPPHVFGSTCFVHNFTPGLDKLSAQSIKCVFCGYTGSQKGYRCFSPTLCRYLVSADVTFFNDVLFFESPSLSPPLMFEILPLSPLPMASPSTVLLPFPTSDPIPLASPVHVYHCRATSHLPF